MAGIRVGYVRVSTNDQTLEIQKNALNVDKFFEDVWSGKDCDRPGFKALMEFLRDGDTLVVHRLDRLSRKLSDLLNTVNDLLNKNIQIEFVHEKIFLGPSPSPMQILFLGILGAFAEFERNVIDERRAAGIAFARSKGVYKGRKPRFTQDMLRQMEEMKSKGAEIKLIAKYLGISRTSVYNYLKYKGPATRKVQNEKNR